MPKKQQIIFKNRCYISPQTKLSKLSTDFQKLLFSPFWERIKEEMGRNHNLYSENEVSWVYWVQLIWMHKWNHLIVNICTKYNFFLAIGWGSSLPFPPSFSNLLYKQQEINPCPEGGMMEQAVLQLLDPEFWEDSPARNVSGFLVSGGDWEAPCDFPVERGLGTKDGKHRCAANTAELEKGHSWSCTWTGLGAEVEGLSRNSLSSMPNDPQRWC